MIVMMVLFQISKRFLDTNECLKNPCHVNASCTDTDGSYHCDCNRGFSGSGTLCQSKQSLFISFVKVKSF